ncbi:MAG: geranylgeranyl pyrophosphate synthase, partial [Phycisphaerales bacterium]|nr:geranylgeranyl pyrophosphate synthase [Phycisphaerales bacterium]
GAAVSNFHYDASARHASGRRFPAAAGFAGVVVASAQRMSHSSSVDAPAILKRHGDAVNGYFKVLRDRYASAPPRLIDAMEYSLMAGGKRLRPALVLECFAACSGGNDNGAGRQSALAAAAAMELIHTFSLVHDDLPAMDDDDLRRGRPTNHKVFGEAMAILAGDAMVTVAFEVLATDADPAALPAMVRELASASGPQGMIGGQVLDIDSENTVLSLEGLQRIHRMKTGALLTASCRLGAIAAGQESHVSAMGDFGRHLGLAFQIVDDVLDVTSTPEQMGKATKKDAGKGKNTYPSLLGLEASQREAEAQLSAAMSALAPLGSAGAGLRALAKFVVDRTN